jgi:hypothetical protein
MNDQEEPYGLAFGARFQPRSEGKGTGIVLDGHVLERTVDADGAWTLTTPTMYAW